MTLPVSIRGRYQLCVCHAGSEATSAHTATLMAATSQAMRDFGVDPRKFLARVGPGGSGAPDPRQPLVAVIFALGEPFPGAPDLAAVLEGLLADGVLIIPVVDDKSRFGDLMPSALAHLNGLSLAECGASFERLASRILEGYGLLRERRRLFISYRRQDASGVATQLYEALDAAGFDVFLDTHGRIRAGEPFQEVLWHRLADTEIVLLLDTPGFLGSRWTEEELARANTSCLQLLQVLWPGQQSLAAAAFSTYLPLEAGDFASAHTLGPQAQLTQAEVDVIVDAAEGLRARALAMRHNFLVRQFVQDVTEAGLQATLTLDRALVVRPRPPKVGDQRLVLPAVGVPDAQEYETLDGFWRRELDAGRSYAGPPALLYDERGIRSRWVSHLRWLNANLSCAQGVALTEIPAWLRSTFTREVPDELG